MLAIRNVRQVLFIRTDRLGETILNLPAVACLKSDLPTASLSVLVQPKMASLIADAPGVDRVLSYDEYSKASWWYRAFNLANRLRPHGFELAIVSNPRKESHLAVWLAGIPIRVGYSRKWDFLLTHRLAERKALGDRHEVEYNLDLVTCLGLDRTVPQWQFPRFQKEQEEIRPLLERQGVRLEDPFVAVHPLSSTPQKLWPLARFQTLIQKVSQQLRTPVVVVGSEPWELSGSEHRMSVEGVVNLTTRLNLRQLAAVLQCARVLISSDSGPVHLAAALKTSTLVLFGSPHAWAGPTRWGPWGQGHAIVWKPSMEAITVEEVFATLQSMLGSRLQSR